MQAYGILSSGCLSPSVTAHELELTIHHRRRILPEPALSKVLFPTMKGLHDVVPTSSLPQGRSV